MKDPNAARIVQMFSVLVAELTDVVPRRVADKPNLLVSVCASAPSIRIQQLMRKASKQWYSGNIVVERADLAPDTQFRTQMEAKEASHALANRLSAAGYTVNRNETIWSVYVIELDGSHLASQGAGYVYVGETSKDPSFRFQEHIGRARNSRGRLYSPVVAKHGRRLRSDLAPTEKFFCRESAKLGEALWAERLRSLGYIVEGGH